MMSTLECQSLSSLLWGLESGA